MFRKCLCRKKNWLPTEDLINEILKQNKNNPNIEASRISQTMNDEDMVLKLQKLIYRLQQSSKL